ncbi:MAG: bacteriohemerythrin [Betaproteobacteria bacterium]|nr:bacteriohemerythrin [Betaproteobacteria bacterium]
MSELTKIEVASGVFWVEAPGIGLRVLCACPADVVKHLMKRGLILPVERKGFDCETGPNAILLSDVLLQNGRFSNLAEFPVLQMLYRQGMIVPGHPNNTGGRPLLIGLREQVDAQLQYIYRGNYGLVSEEEILESGVGRPEAREMMRLKLRFAFGAIQHPRELLEPVYVDDEPVVLRGGLQLRRLALNRFEFAYAGESVTVDLNLPPNVHYDVPYTLGLHLLRREYFAVIHSGEGDGWDPNRPTMGSILIFQGRIYLIDAGPNIQASLSALGIGTDEIEGIFHTHSHDDHFAGLAQLVRSDHRIKYYATAMVRSSVAKKLAALMSIEEGSFADYFDCRDLAFDVWNDIEGLQVKPLFSPHPVETSVFLFRAIWEGGWRTYAHFADIVALDVLDSMVTDDRTFFERVKSDYAIPADVKKIDIGGGLIHGQAKDFRGDRSRKILLSHLARRYTNEEKEIGSGATFGAVDILIPGNQDYMLRAAHEFLRSYFPDAPRHQLLILLNAPLVTFNPQSIVIKAGEANRDIYLILTGTVEMIEAGSGVHVLVHAGSLVGEISGLRGTPSAETYRAENFVQALRLPCDLYLEFISNNCLLAGITRLQAQREFLRRAPLFGEGMADPALNRVAAAARSFSLAAAETFDPKGVGLVMIRSGEAERRFAEEVHETLAPGDFIGEETVLFDAPSRYSMRAKTAVEAIAVPSEVLRPIPVVRWKLIETHERHLRRFAETTGLRQRLAGLAGECGVKVQRMDNQHVSLLASAVALLAVIEADKGRELVLETLRAMIAFARYHFDQEEALLKMYGFPDLERHAAIHRRLLAQAAQFQDRIGAGASISAAEAEAWLKGWIIEHIRVEDAKYSAFLNSKNIF